MRNGFGDSVPARFFARRVGAAPAGAPPGGRRHQFSGALRNHGRKPDAQRAKSTCAWWRSLSKRRGAAFPCWPEPAATTPPRSISLAKELASLRVDGILSVTPYYNKPTQEGLYQHYKAIAAAVSLPIMVYNVPRRTGVNIEPATLKRLAEIENIVGVKEASGDIGQIASILGHSPEEFTVLSGDDALALPLIALGGRGVISVASNEIPAEMTRLVQLVPARRFRRRAAPAAEVSAADGSEFHRVQPDSGESGDGRHGTARAGLAAAAVRAQARERGENPRRAGIVWVCWRGRHVARAN